MRFPETQACLKRLLALPQTAVGKPLKSIGIHSIGQRDKQAVMINLVVTVVFIKMKILFERDYKIYRGRFGVG